MLESALAPKYQHLARAVLQELLPGSKLGTECLSRPHSARRRRTCK